MEGLWVKLGQYMSTRADVLPAAYIRLLKQLQDSLPPRPLEEVFLQIFYLKIVLVYAMEEKNAFRKTYTFCDFNKNILHILSIGDDIIH